MRVADKTYSERKHIEIKPGIDPDSTRKKSGKKQSALRKLASVLHLWLGLASGLVIMIMALTGAIYAFQPELSDAFQPYLFAKQSEQFILPTSKIISIAQSQLPGKQVSRVTYSGTGRSVSVAFNNKKEHYNYMVFLNPYSGEVLKVKDMDHDFFRQVLNGHMHLWLPDPVGKYINRSAALIFGIMIVSGIIIWWPKKWNKSTRRQSFKVKLDASPKRLNYDLHNVLGFYVSWIMIFVVLSGLVWGFETVRNAEYWIFSGGKKYPAIEKAAKKTVLLTDDQQPLDKIDAQIRAQYDINVGKTQYLIPATGKTNLIVRYFPEQKRFFNGDYLTFDQYTGKELVAGVKGKYADANGGEMANRLNYDIHTGSIGGLPLRMVIFLSALVTASLPVTGFYIWWGKRRKK